MIIQITIDCDLEDLLGNVEYCKHLINKDFKRIEEIVINDLDVQHEIIDSNCSREINIILLYRW